MSLDAFFFGSGGKNNVIENYLGGLPFSINAPIETGDKNSIFGFQEKFYKTDEDKAKDILLQGGKGSANFTQEESNAIRAIGPEINEAYAQGFLSDVSKMIEGATGRTVAIRSDDPPPIRMTKKGGGFTYRDPDPASFNTMYNTYVVPTSSSGFLEKEEEKEEEVEYDFVPLLEREYGTSTRPGYIDSVPVERYIASSPSDLSGFTPSISAALTNLNGVAG